jgi:N-acetylglucosaminyldiphosphoundecaprenol N-acetyl-beta-D-mannosaminyltransferase
MTREFPLGHVKITSGDLDTITQQVADWIAAGESTQHACIPLNLSKYVMSQSDAKLAAAINGADLVVADGVPILWLARRLGYRGVCRVTGVDLAEALLKRARGEGWRIYFLGARRERLEEAVARVRERFDDPPVAGMRDGYFSDGDIPEIIEEINAARPDILLLGLGLPQKEYFVADHLKALAVPFVITVGGAFDIWAGVKKRAPSIVTRLGIEWAWRSFYDLSRARLIARYGLRFLKDLIWPVGNGRRARY